VQQLLSLDAFASDLQALALSQDLDFLADMSVDAMASLYHCSYRAS